MPAFSSIAEMEQYINSKLQIVVSKVEQTIYQVIQGFMKQYYAEYEPQIYQRTMTFWMSLVKSNVTSIGNGYKIEVYFDAGLMHHAIHALGWDEGQILEANLHGQHGGAGKFSSNIWDNSIAIFNRELFDILKRMLIEAGLPVQ